MKGRKWHFCRQEMIIMIIVAGFVDLREDVVSVGFYEGLRGLLGVNGSGNSSQH